MLEELFNADSHVLLKYMYCDMLLTANRAILKMKCELLKIVQVFFWVGFVFIEIVILSFIILKYVLNYVI